MEFIKKHKGFFIFVVGFVFNLVETLYFGIGADRGFNLNPMSLAELLCDYICSFMMVLGIYMMALNARRSQTTTCNINMTVSDLDTAKVTVEQIASELSKKKRTLIKS